MPGTDYAIAFGGGVVSFLSPCVLPLVPGYLSVTSGLASPEVASSGRTRALAVARGAGLFIAGFSGVFVVLGLSATALGSLLLSRQVPITRFAGLVLVVMALFMVASTLPLRWVPWREVRFHPRTRSYGAWGPPLAGAAFAFGWTPCIGPVLGSVLAVAAREGSTPRGALLLGVYAAGLGLPFLVSALAFGRLVGARRWVGRNSATMTRGAAAVLGSYGVLLALDQLAWVTLRLQEGLSAVGLGGLLTLG